MRKLVIIVVSILSFVSSSLVAAIFLVNLFTLNLLPLHYLLPISLALLTLLIASIAILAHCLFLPAFSRRRTLKAFKNTLETAQTPKTSRPIKPLPIFIALIIQILLITASFTALYYLSHINAFLDKITTTNLTQNTGKNQTTNLNQTTSLTEPLNLSKDPFNIFIGGIDASELLSDVNMVLSVNPQTHKVLITGIPRDYYVAFHNTKQKDKLTHSGAFMGANIENTMLTVSDFMQIKLDYYLRVDFNSITTLVDTLGGITIYSDTNFRSSVMPKCYFHAGQNHINGTCALAFARERKNYSNGDLHRVENQAVIMEAIIRKLSDKNTLLSKYEQLLANFSNIVRTNLPKQYLTDFIRFELDQVPNWQVQKYRLNGTHIFNIQSPYYQNRPVTIIEPDQHSIESARKKINQIRLGR